MVRALRSDWTQKGVGSPNLELCRSRDGGVTWQCAVGEVAWDYQGFGEVSAIRLQTGGYLAALRRQIPGTAGEGFEDTVLTESLDGGAHWSTPRALGPSAEVHVYLTELAEGRILATYSNYHLPWGVFAVVSGDGGRTFDVDHSVQLALSGDFYVGGPVTLQLPDGALVTAYATTSYFAQSPDNTTCEVVRWRLP